MYFFFFAIASYRPRAVSLHAMHPAGAGRAQVNILPSLTSIDLSFAKFLRRLYTRRIVRLTCGIDNWNSVELFDIYSRCHSILEKLEKERYVQFSNFFNVL